MDGDGHISFKDTVTYENLEAGHEYTVYGKLVKSDDGTPVVDAEGNEVTSLLTFTADGTSGSVEMPFEFDPDPSCTGFRAVVYETVTDPSADTGADDGETW